MRYLIPNSDGQPEPTELMEPNTGTRKRKKTHTDKWDSCVSKVKAKGGSYNPYAICTSRLGQRSFLKHGQVLRSGK